MSSETRKTGRKIRKPGETFDLTDEEILATPARMLNAAQRRHRRALKRRKRAANIDSPRAKANRARKDKCAGITRAGNPCQSFCVKGAKHCMGHLNDAEKAKLGIDRLNEYGNRVRRTQGLEKVSAIATMREAAETAAEKILQRQFAPLGLEFVGFDEDGQPVIIDHGQEAGLVLHGVSKEGDVVVSTHPDMAGQFGIAEKLWDRVYGKPRQTTVLEGGSRPIQVQPVRTAERAQRVANMLHHVGAVPRDPHEGRRRSLPSEPSPEAQPEQIEPSSNVTPLRSDS